MGAAINAAINVKGNASFVHNVATESGGKNPPSMRCFVDVFDVTVLAKIGTFRPTHFFF